MSRRNRGGDRLYDRRRHNGNGHQPQLLVPAGREQGGIQLATKSAAGGFTTTPMSPGQLFQPQTSSQSQVAAWKSADPGGEQQGDSRLAYFGNQPYPVMPEVPANKPLLKSLGATGTAIFGGIITSEEYNEDFYWKDAIQIYESMIRNDAQIYAVAQMLELPIRRATWSIEPASDDPKDKEIASFIDSCLFDDMRYQTISGRVLSQKWDDILRHILMMMRFGFMAFEQCWRVDDGWVKWARWTPLLPRTIWRWWVGPDNELAGIQQWTFKDYGYRFIDIPADKLLLFVHRQEGNNYEGFSSLRPAYKHWFYKDQFYKIDAINLERNAVQMPVMHLPENFSELDITTAQSMLGNIRANESMGLTLPPGWDAEYMRGFEKQSAQIMPSVQHHDVMIARAILAPWINLGSTETGSYNLSETQMDFFRHALQAEAEYVQDVIDADAIRRLVDWNFDGVEAYPSIKCSKIAAQDVEKIANALSKLANQAVQFVHPTPETEDFLRDELGLPAAPVSVVQTTNPTSPANPDRPDGDATTPQDHTTQQSKPQVGPQAGKVSPDENEAQVEAEPGGGDGGDGGGGSASTEALTREVRLLREAYAAVLV